MVVEFGRSAGKRAKTQNMRPFRVLDGEDKHEGDIEFQQGFGQAGDHTIVDIGLTTAVTAVVLRGAVTGEGDAASRYERLKKDKYGDKCRRIGATFIPFIMENQGRLGPAAKQFFNNLVRAITDGTSVSLADTKFFWLQQFSISVKRSLARAVVLRIANMNAAAAGGGTPIGPADVIGVASFFSGGRKEGEGGRRQATGFEDQCAVRGIGGFTSGTTLGRDREKRARVDEDTSGRRGMGETAREDRRADVGGGQCSFQGREGHLEWGRGGVAATWSGCGGGGGASSGGEQPEPNRKARSSAGAGNGSTVGGVTGEGRMEENDDI